MIKGKGVSAGVGFGNTVILKNEKRKIEKTTVEDSNAEMDRLKKAIEEVTKEIYRNRKRNNVCISYDLTRSSIDTRNRKWNKRLKI